MSTIIEKYKHYFKKNQRRKWNRKRKVQRELSGAFKNNENMNKSNEK